MRTVLARVTRRTLLLGALGLALFAGGAWAGTHYLITSVNQIKPSVRSALRGERGPRGLTGARGAAGPQGQAGATGAPGAAGTDANLKESAITGTQVNVSESAPTATSTATCPAGDIVLGGGWSGALDPSTVDASAPGAVNGDDTWSVVITDDGTSEETFTAYALCASQ